MIYETMWDIRYFLFMFFLCVALFANAILILDLAQEKAAENAVSEEDEYTRIIPESIGNNIFDSALNQYLLGLGEFTYDDYPDNGVKTMVWIYFILATLFTNINFLNLLIAIISDTYARITESKQRYALMQRTEIFADFINVVNLNPKMTQNRYLYIVQPIDIGDGSDDWSGSINALKKMINSGNKQV